MTAKDPNLWPLQLGGGGGLVLFLRWLAKRVVKFRPVTLGISDSESISEIHRLAAENAKAHVELAAAHAAIADLRVRVAELAPRIENQ
jgi:hypothetical protein